jgi:hypothetical protein
MFDIIGLSKLKSALYAAVLSLFRFNDAAAKAGLGFKIRKRTLHSKDVYRTEYQVVDRRTIVDRLDSLDVARQKYPAAAFTDEFGLFPTKE